MVWAHHRQDDGSEVEIEMPGVYSKDVTAEDAPALCRKSIPLPKYGLAAKLRLALPYRVEPASQLYSDPLDNFRRGGTEGGTKSKTLQH